MLYKTNPAFAHIQSMDYAIRDILGLPTDSFELIKFAVRAVLVFGLALLFVRINGKRMFKKTSAFDFVVAIMLGSILSRAITGSSPFLPTLVAGSVLVLVHWLLSYFSYKHSHFGDVIKGTKTCLIKDGELQRDAMEKSKITKKDLETAARAQAKIKNLSQVKEAYLERNGEISIIPFEDD